MQTGLLQTTDEELYRLIQDFAEKRRWHLKYAKFNWRSHQSLLTHSLNVASLSASLLDFLDKKGLIKVDEKLRLQIILTGFLHDSGKESELSKKLLKLFWLVMAQSHLILVINKKKRFKESLIRLRNILTGSFRSLIFKICWMRRFGVLANLASAKIRRLFHIALKKPLQTTH